MIFVHLFAQFLYNICLKIDSVVHSSTVRSSTDSVFFKHHITDFFVMSGNKLTLLEAPSIVQCRKQNHSERKYKTKPMKSDCNHLCNHFNEKNQ